MKSAIKLSQAIMCLLVIPNALAETPEATAARMLDPTRNAAAFKDPKAFVHWTANMMNPATSLALAQQGMDPNTYLHMAAGMMNPATLQNYMQFTDPSVAMRWMAAGVDPSFYAALIAQGLNPSNYLAWMAAPLSPQALNTGLRMLNPALYGNWMAAPTSPQAVNTMMAPLNPNLYMSWLGAGLNPQTFGAWSQMPATSEAVSRAAVDAGAYAGTVANSGAGGNPFDPAALLKLMPFQGATPNP